MFSAMWGVWCVGRVRLPLSYVCAFLIVFFLIHIFVCVENGQPIVSFTRGASTPSSKNVWTHHRSSATGSLSVMPKSVIFILSHSLTNRVHKERNEGEERREREKERKREREKRREREREEEKCTPNQPMKEPI